MLFLGFTTITTQLSLTGSILQMIGLAWDVHDTRLLLNQATFSGNSSSGERKESVLELSELDKDDRQQKIKHTAINPSLLDIICFAFCYIGCLTGQFSSCAIYNHP